jgi:hypothetical protein
MTLKKIVVSASLLLLLIGIVLYHIPQHVQKSYIAVGYKNQLNDEIKTNLDLDVTIKKRLFSKHIIDGTLSIGGQRYLVSNHIYYNPSNEPMPVDNTMSLLETLRDKFSGRSYRLMHRVTDFNPLHAHAFIIVDISRDFQYIYVSVNDKQQVGTNYVGPASNMQEVIDVSHRLFGDINRNK